MKRVLNRLAIIILGFSVLSVPSSVQAQPQNATESLKSFIETLRVMEFPVADSAAHAEKVKKADRYLDLEAMGRKALGDHWTKAAPEQQKVFMELLWKLIANIAYPRSHAFFGSLPIEYSGPKAIAKGLEIKTVVKNQDAALDAPVVYDLYEQGEQWKINDIFLDGVSITDDLKVQFDKIIADSSFEGLLTRMRERLAKAEEENTKK